MQCEARESERAGVAIFPAFSIYGQLKSGKTMEQIRLKDLYEACKRHMKAGHGDRSLVVAADNEGNFYHGMFYTLTLITPENADGFAGLIGDNAEPDINNIIVVG